MPEFILIQELQILNRTELIFPQNMENKELNL